MSWQEIYASPGQSVWALLVLSALFLAWLAVGPRPAPGRGAEPRAARFVGAWAAVFAVVSILDATLPGLAGAPMLPFVLLGDFRVFLLLEAVSRPDRPLTRDLAVAAAWTLVVPAVAAAGYVGWVASRGPLPAPVADVLAGAASSQALWLIHETAFLALALVLRAVVPPRNPCAARWLREVLAFVAAYYGLWALADVLVLAGADGGWLLRMLPNQLYYGAFVPFAYARFFAASPSPASAAASSRVQAAR